jgi:hypothetical protein
MEHFLRFSKRVAGLIFSLAVLCAVSTADVGLMLNEALSTGPSKWTGAGHTAVYLSGICADTPVTLRACRADENGVVLTSYDSFGEDSAYHWNAIPLNLYLYGVEDEGERTLYATPTVRWVLEERYRVKYMGAICHGKCASDPSALWRESIAATFDHDIYMFVARTTPEQDQALLEKLLRAGNVSHYNAVRYNCADFVRDVVNTYFPGAARADRINDFGMTGPKAIAKSFTHYAVRHPEIDFRVQRFTQIPGEFRPSHDNRKGTEQLVRANKWRLPLLAVGPEILLFATGNYLVSGRFNPELELQRRPSPEAAELSAKLRAAQASGDRAAVKLAEQRIKAARAAAMGTPETWAGYAADLQQYEAEAVEGGYLQDATAFRNIASPLLRTTWITLQDGGGLWLTPRNGRGMKIGMSSSTLTADASDPRASYLLALARVDAELRRKPKNRETLDFFRRDWEQMKRLRGELPTLARARHEGDAHGEQ